jgi:dTDP-glucose 4,6-dehydratase
VELKLLVTGGAGFIGSNFIRFFLSEHPDAFLVNFDKLTYAGNPANLAGLESTPGYRFAKGDIAEAEIVQEIFGEDFDAVINFAAETHVDRSIADASQFIRTNVQGTHTLLEAARRAKVSLFLQVSTDEVYGSLAPGEMADEEWNLRPNSPYAASKAASDLLVRSYSKTYQLPAIITRCSNNYGPRQFPEKLIPLMITNAMEGKKLPVYGDGLNERDWIYVEDHCRALERVLMAGSPGEIYNIGQGEPVTNLEIVRRLLQVLERSPEMIEFVADRPGHDRRYGLNTGKICRELGWAPRVGLEEGLARTIGWYRSNPEWVRKAKGEEFCQYYEKTYGARGSPVSKD